MSSAMIKSTKFMKRAESRKSHSWWWDSHISPKNSKWLSENLEEMDQSVKRMLKLIEEDADSFAKKAEMYYQKRPQLVSHVEEFYRMYRSLAERYDLLTGELRKNVPNLDLESQGSGISEVSSESRRKSGPRPAGLEAFLGSDDKEGDESSESETESESDSDGSSVISEEELLRRKVTELENELKIAKEKLLERSEILPDNLGESIIDDSDRGIENFEREIARYKTSLSDRDQEIRELKEAINDANRTLSEENSRIQGEIAKLSKEKTVLEDNLKELDLNRVWMEGELQRLRDGKVESEEQLKASLKERDELGSKMEEIGAELTSKKEQIEHMELHLKQMHMEQMELVRGSERSCRKIEELKEEIEKQRVSIAEGAEGKREAIRQLCFSIEHYRNDYQQLLRLAFPGQKRLQVKA